MLQSRGVADLLVAEKKAQELIEEARKRKFFYFKDFFNNISFLFFLTGKNKRIKDAQSEAKAEIEHFKAERERRYKGLEQQVSYFIDHIYLFRHELIFF